MRGWCRRSCRRSRAGRQNPSHQWRRLIGLLRAHNHARPRPPGRGGPLGGGLEGLGSGGGLHTRTRVAVRLRHVQRTCKRSGEAGGPGAGAMRGARDSNLHIRNSRRARPQSWRIAVARAQFRDLYYLVGAAGPARSLCELATLGLHPAWLCSACACSIRCRKCCAASGRELATPSAGAVHRRRCPPTAGACRPLPAAHVFVQALEPQSSQGFVSRESGVAIVLARQPHASGPWPTDRASTALLTTGACAAEQASKPTGRQAGRQEGGRPLPGSQAPPWPSSTRAPRRGAASCTPRSAARGTWPPLRPPAWRCPASLGTRCGLSRACVAVLWRS